MGMAIGRAWRGRNIGVLLLGLVGLGLSACARIPGPEDGPAAVPVTPALWVADSISSQNEVSANWLASFRDPQLNILVAEALRYNNSLAQAEARLAAARASARSVRSGLFPTLDGTANATGSRTVVPQAVGADANTTTTLSVGLQTSWEIDIWGRVRNRVGAAQADADASASDVAAARLSLAASTAQAWFALIEARVQTEIAQEDVENREGSLRLIQRRFASGLSGSLDLRLARSDLATRRAALESRAQVEKETARALEILLGRYPAAALGYDHALPPLPPLPGTGAPAELLTRRPDIQAAERRLEAAGLRAHDARKALLPRITLTGNATSTDTAFAELFDLEQLAGNLIAGLVQPIFRGGQVLADAEAARARAEEAVYFYVQTVLTAFEEAENALAAEARLTARLTALAMSYEEALAAEELTQRDYRQGLTTIFNLLDAQARRFSAQSALAAAERERLTNRVRLHLAIAGPFAPGVEAPTRSDQRP